MKRRRLSDEIADKIKTLILDGAWGNGERLPPERELAERFGVSRPSLREAIHSLVATGLLRSQHGGGTYVADEVGNSFRDPLQAILLSSPDAQRDLLEFRHMVEGACSFYAAQRATAADRQRLTAAFERLKAHHTHPESADDGSEESADAHFHLVIAEASHNAILLHTMRNTYDVIGNEVRVNFGGMFSDGSGARDDLMQQHQALYDAIMEGRARDALDAAHAHIRYVQDTLLRLEQAQVREARSLRRRSDSL